MTCAFTVVYMSCLVLLLWSNNGVVVVEASHQVFTEQQSVSAVNIGQKHRTAYHFQPTQHWINGNITILFFFFFSDLCGNDDAMMSMQQQQVACMDKLQYDIGICVRVRSKSTKCKECLPVFLDFEACFRVADMALLITERKKNKKTNIYFFFF